MDDPEGFARQVVGRGLSVREAEKLARGDDVAPARRARKAGPAVAAKPAEAHAPQDADTAALEKLLTEALQMPVSVRLKGEGGMLTLEFGNLEQLDDLCRLLQGGSVDA